MARGEPPDQRANCSDCGLPCSNNHGTPSCSAGTCSIFVRTRGFKDLRRRGVANGCETNIFDNVNNCGSGNNVCPPQGGTPAVRQQQLHGVELRGWQGRLRRRSLERV